MALGSILIISISNHFIIALLFYFAFYFTFASLYQKYQKYYLSDLTLVSDREGIDNP